MKLIINVLFLIFVFYLGSCQTQPSKHEKPLIVCTTNIITDAVKTIGGDAIAVVGLMGAGVDPHLYKPTQGDLHYLTDADMIFFNGLHLEGKIAEVLEKLKETKRAFPVSAEISSEKLIKVGEQTYDPHIWHNVSLWKECVSFMSKTLQNTYPNLAPQIAQNTEKYLKELEILDTEVRNNLAQIPENQRILITAHDAFEYFGKAYQIQVRGLQGISTLSEAGLQDVTNLVNFIVEKKIKAIFTESTMSQKDIDAVILGCKDLGHQVNLGGSLFSDALGESGSESGNYIGMMRTNIQTIVGALK